MLAPGGFVAGRGSLEGLRGGAGDVDAVTGAVVEDRFEGEPHTGHRCRPGPEQGGKTVRGVQARQGAVGGDSPHERCPPGRESTGVRAAGVHDSVPPQQPLQQAERGSGQAGSVEPAEQAPEGRPGPQPGVGVDLLHAGHVQPDPSGRTGSFEQLPDPPGPVGGREFHAQELAAAGIPVVGADGEPGRVGGRQLLIVRRSTDAGGTMRGRARGGWPGPGAAHARPRTGACRRRCRPPARC